MAGWNGKDGVLTPRRRRGVEILDAPDVDSTLRRRSHRDIALSNALLGGSRAMAQALRQAMAGAPETLTVLDVGTGSGETLDIAVREAARAGVQVRAVGLDLDERLARSCTSRAACVCASALSLPFANRSTDVVICSLLLHHFAGEELHQAVRELDRVARRRVIIHDLRRSWVAAAGLWAVSFPLAFHPVSRHDGVTSVLRGFTAPELSQLVAEATKTEPHVSRHLGFRLIASWTPTD
ncbi:MAG: methyltransferase domain-containing protein [Gemmatimonadaceae bacterium]